MYFKDEYFSAEVIDSFIDELLKRNPHFIQRMKLMMRDDTENFKEIFGDHFFELIKVAGSMSFYREYMKNMDKKYLEKLPDPSYHAAHHLSNDLTMRVRDLLDSGIFPEEEGE
ncbi:hypothetical protein [Mesorhizobium amorphae]|uniref:hypothetical protein n=1 Tax=Mesorhizobium amorphae TaxID=71433 RepID=UPI0011852A77|nr:hypothetical protein [Mesorhizobium amorphae]